MERLMECIKKKNHIEYDMNCIEKYIHGGDYDGRLKKSWENLEISLETVEKEIALLSNSETKEVEEKKLDLVEKIHEHEVAIRKLKSQVSELESVILSKIKK